MPKHLHIRLDVESSSRPDGHPLDVARAAGVTWLHASTFGPIGGSWHLWGCEAPDPLPAWLTASALDPNDPRHAIPADKLDALAKWQREG